MTKEPHLLIILDGFGYNPNHEYNAIYQAYPKNYLKWISTYPWTTLRASGSYVGLLDHMIGNSEVGHMTIGCGRVIKQPVKILTEEIDNGSFFKNHMLLNHFAQLKNSGKTLHLMGLLSDAGIHSYDLHLFALIKMAASHGIKNIVVHPFLDGRDVPPKSAAFYLKKLDSELKKNKVGVVGSLHGRFYAMDRDSNWARTEKSYNILTGIESVPEFDNWESALAYWYDQDITDEFIPPTKISKNAEIKNDDALIFFNIREDRARQLAQAFIDHSFDKFKIKQLNFLWIVTAVCYSPNFNVDILCYKEVIKNTLFDVLEKENKLIFSIAESEKYAHITYFFNGGREIIRPNETRVLIPSKSQNKDYSNLPEMSAPEITKRLLAALNKNIHDFYLINYANADMVAHSGNFNATCLAINFLDQELKKLYDIAVKKLNGTIYITSDHGNAEYMFDPYYHQVKTAHTTNPVPFLILNNSLTGSNKIDLTINQLADVAPFILKRLNLSVPDLMSVTPR